MHAGSARAMQQRLVFHMSACRRTRRQQQVEGAAAQAAQVWMFVFLLFEVPWLCKVYEGRCVRQVRSSSG